MDRPSYLQATRVAYDLVARDYADLLRGELDAKPFHRAMLATFAELVLGSGGGPVGDLGCGPGRVTGHLHRLGVAAFGIDLSPAMLSAARRDWPLHPFAAGGIGELPLRTASLAGALLWYSIIHTPPADQPALLAEVGRVVRPGGFALLAFQVGAERVHLEQAYGHALSLEVFRLAPEAVGADLAAAGFTGVARLVTAPDGGERQDQAFLLARRTPGTSPS